MNGGRPVAGPESILVVDDTPETLRLLASVLQSNGFKVRSAISGAAALQSIERAVPDLVLLDARMPEMDGFALCRHLKAAPRTREVPVIFISGLNETEDKLMAFTVGGVDYITKPFQIPEVLVRINTQLKQMRLQRTLAEQNQHLDEIVQQRTCELLNANRQLALLNRTKNDFLTLISHELRTPLNGLLGAADLAFDEHPAGSLHPQLRQMYEDSRHRLMGLLDDALLLGEIELNGRDEVSQSVSLDEVLNEMQPAADEVGRPWNMQWARPDGRLGQVMGEPVILQKALLCLWETCLKCHPVGHSHSPALAVTVAAQPQPGRVELVFTTRHHTLSRADQECFFEVLAVSKPMPGGDPGLAPALAARIASLFGGRIAVRNLEPAGIELKICLPRPPAIPAPNLRL
jgi:DNA-binding response OmpR family regulator